MTCCCKLSGITITSFRRMTPSCVSDSSSYTFLKYIFVPHEFGLLGDLNTKSELQMRFNCGSLFLAIIN